MFPGGPQASGPQAGPSASFLSLFGSADLSLQEIADKAHQLQHKIDENAEREKASLRTAAEQKHLEIERHAAELARHAASSIEAYKTVQLQTAERQKAYQQAVVRQQAEQAKKLIDQQAAQAIGAVETRDRQLSLQRQQQELVQRGAPQFLSALGGPLPGGLPNGPGPSSPMPGGAVPYSPGGDMPGMPGASGMPAPTKPPFPGSPMPGGRGLPDFDPTKFDPSINFGQATSFGNMTPLDAMPQGMSFGMGGMPGGMPGAMTGAPPHGIPSMQSMPPRPGSPMPAAQ